MNRINLWGYDVSIDAIIQTIGTFVGALAAGAVAFLVMQLQFRFERKKQKIAENSAFLKSYHNVMFLGLQATENIRLLIDTIEAIENRPEIAINKSKRDMLIDTPLSSLESLLQLMNEIKDETIPHGDIYLTFITVKQTLASIIYVTRTSGLIDDINIDSVKSLQNHFDAVYGKFVKISSEEEKELKKLVKSKGMTYMK